MPDIETLRYLLPPGLAWLVAQVAKYFLAQSKGKGRWKNLYRSGNMPSAHTATMTALTVAVGAYDGAGSGLFALSLVVTLVTIYDALMVRRSSGEQGIALRKLLEKSPFSKDPLPYQALGHRPLEVLVGALVGIAVSTIVVFFITN